MIENLRVARIGVISKKVKIALTVVSYIIPYLERDLISVGYDVREGVNENVEFLTALCVTRVRRDFFSETCW